MSKVTITGRIGRDPESRTYTSKKTGGEAEMVKFSLASGEKPNTKWYNCAAFGRLVEPAMAKIAKGDQVEVTGELKEREYEKDGETRTSLDITVDEFEVDGRTYSWKAEAADDDVGF